VHNAEWVWRFTLRRDSLLGELRLLDSTKYREIRTVRSRQRRRSGVAKLGC
jgi:hypothetical protein